MKPKTEIFCSHPRLEYIGYGTPMASGNYKCITCGIPKGRIDDGEERVVAYFRGDN